MAYAGLAKCQSSSVNRIEVPKRYTHRASSHTYLKMWKGSNIDYLRCMDQAQTMRNMPKLVERILRLESAMKLRGLVPFVHAMPAAAKVPMNFYGKKESNFFSLRPHEMPFMANWEDAIKEIYRKEIRSQKPSLLSVSYALTSGIRPLESAASWGFANHLGNAQNIPMTEIFEKAIKKSAHPHQDYFLERGKVLIRKYGRLRVGDFIIIGVPPEKLTRWFFDSKPYNIPTGNDIRSVVDNPTRFNKELIQEKTHMATMIMCSETLDPSSGLVMVLANDSKEVDAFCGKDKLKPPCEVDLYQEILHSSDASFEEEEKLRRQELDEQLEKLLAEFSGKLKFKDTKLALEEMDFLASDFQQLAI